MNTFRKQSLVFHHSDNSDCLNGMIILTIGIINNRVIDQLRTDKLAA